MTVHPFGLAIGVEDIHGRFLTAMQDGVDRELPGSILHLAAAEVVGRCEVGAFSGREGGDHRASESVTSKQAQHIGGKEGIILVLFRRNLGKQF